MIHLLGQIIPALLAVSILYLTYLMSRLMLSGGFTMQLIFGCFSQKAPGLNEFLLFIFRSFYISTAALVLYNHVSNHIIISLDILYFFSTMIILLYHLEKLYMNPLFVKNVY